MFSSGLRIAELNLGFIVPHTRQSRLERTYQCISEANSRGLKYG
jgi:hypothetical protein